MNNDYLNVWYTDKLVGKIWRNAVGMIGFRYENTWKRHGFPISQQLPFDKEEFIPEVGKAHLFFVNLLPEAQARSHIIRDLKISNSDFELLKAIGGECAGALSILPISLRPSDIDQYKKLSDEELTRILIRKGGIYQFSSESDRPRLSLAGAHDKCPILYSGNDYLLPQNASPSSHIIKFEVAEYRNIPLYECFTTYIAGAVGLPVANVELHQHHKELFLLIKRYDRIVVPNEPVVRLHQEDFCQALGIGYDKKYQVEGGPSFKECYQLIQQVVINPIKDLENLLKWQIFNVLAGNSDGHAKNLSLLYSQNHQPELAPFYDLVCTRAVERIDTKLALSVGGEFNPDLISKDHWLRMAQECNVREPYFMNLIREMSVKLNDTLIPLEEEFQNKYGNFPALQRVRKVINNQCKRILKQFS